jgi:hypothetical protein
MYRWDCRVGWSFVRLLGCEIIWLSGCVDVGAGPRRTPGSNFWPDRYRPSAEMSGHVSPRRFRMVMGSGCNNCVPSASLPRARARGQDEVPWLRLGHPTTVSAAESVPNPAHRRLPWRLYQRRPTRPYDSRGRSCPRTAPRTRHGLVAHTSTSDRGRALALPPNKWVR